MWFVRTYLKANLKISFKLKTFFLLQAPFLRIYSIEVKLPIRREYMHRDIIGATILAILSGKIFVTKWVRAKPIGTEILWKAERCARTPQIVTCHISQKSDSYHLPGNERRRVLFFFPWLTRSSSFNSPVRPNHWIFCSYLLWASLRKWPPITGKVLSFSLCSFPQSSHTCSWVHRTSPLGQEILCDLSCRKQGLHGEAPEVISGSELKLFCLQFLVSLGNSLVVTALWSYSSWAAVTKYQRLAGLTEIYFLRALQLSDQGPSRFSFLWGLSPSQGDGHPSLHPHLVKRGSSSVSFSSDKDSDSSTGAPPSWPQLNFLKVPSSNTITWGVRTSAYKFWRDANIPFLAWLLNVVIKNTNFEVRLSPGSATYLPYELEQVS